MVFGQTRGVVALGVEMAETRLLSSSVGGVMGLSTPTRTCGFSLL